ncbi:hypothetical protein NLJ89_g2813 [Agrocybe chaxingu]|uniref:Uncharacterized protein n=1 Tax=Agrocybe chaxingu TaxID=84603 RepID=A0A9W8K6K2_9AGAR|nr:hypothetical protein NLJ89_g2813 [Agrocybe chaxingu]
MTMQVLQLGIMIHSLVIGLTLAVTSGSDFTSLTTAIIFHQLFEGLSLGIRIAALPPSKRGHGNDHEHEHEHHHHPHSAHDLEDVEEEPRGRSTSSGSDREDARKAKADREELAVSGGAHVHSPTQEERNELPSQQSPLLDASTKTRPHSCRGPSSSDTGVWASLQRAVNVRNWGIWQQEIHWLQPTLSLLFAVTTPFGMGVGMTLWGGEKGKGDEAQMLLIQGVMSAISAGMLIYAATVEMIAGDFVYGDVDGHSHHHHGHGGPVDSQPAHHHHHHSHHDRDSSAASVPGDVEAFSSPPGQTPAPIQEEKKAESTMMKRALAVVSLFAGATMMVLVGLGE